MLEDLGPIDVAQAFGGSFYSYDVGSAPADGSHIITLNSQYLYAPGAPAFQYNDGETFSFVDMLNKSYATTGFTFDATSATVLAVLHEVAHNAGADHPDQTNFQYNIDIINKCLK